MNGLIKVSGYTLLVNRASTACPFPDKFEDKPAGCPRPEDDEHDACRREHREMLSSIDELRVQQQTEPDSHEETGKATAVVLKSGGCLR